MAHREPLESYLLSYRQGGSKRLLTEQLGFFLVFNPNKDFGDDTFSIDTQTLTESGLGTLPNLTKEDLAWLERFEGFTVARIVKTVEDGLPDRITVGRARNNDVVIRHQTVSRLHAFFSPRDGGLSLTDAGSRNGTRHNGERLKPRWNALLKPGDSLTFGGVTADFESTESFCQLLDQLCRKK